MADTDVTAADVQNAKVFLRAYLAAKTPDGDFTEQGVIDDLLVGPHGFIIAYLLKQIRILRDRQSLLTLQNLPDTESVSDAADAILDNFFETRAQGSFARGTDTVHLTQRVDCLVPRTTRFFRDRSHVFYPDSPTDVFVPASALVPTSDANGNLVDYTFQLNLVAARVGADYNVASGRWLTADRFSPYFSYVESVAPFAFGDGVQSTPDFIAASQNAIALRALINGRSNDATLRQLFPALQQLLTVGMGDPEMMRDLVSERSSGVQLHVGGHMDLYARLATQEIVQTFIVGDLTPRADGMALILRDSAPPSGSFLTAGVVPGDILVVAAGLPEAPTQYVIDQVFANEIWVSPTIPFSVATDVAATTPPPLTYTVGDNYPTFDDKFTVAASTTAFTSTRFAVPNAVILPGGPLYRIKTVNLQSTSGGLTPYVDPLQGGVYFTQRVNAPVTVTPTPGTPLAYDVVCLNPGEAQSDRAIQFLRVGWPAIDLTGQPVQVTYETLAGYATLATYVEDPLNRPNNANTLVRAQHPVYLAFTVPYRLSVSTQLAQQTGLVAFDETASALALVAFINGYQDQDILDQSLLATQARTQANAAVAAIYPFTITYDLLAPNGQVYHYATQDTVTVFPDGATSSAALLNPADFGLPATNYYAALKRQLLLAGVSDRTIRYVASADEVTFFRRS